MASGPLGGADRSQVRFDGLSFDFEAFSTYVTTARASPQVDLSDEARAGLRDRQGKPYGESPPLETRNLLELPVLDGAAGRFRRSLMKPLWRNTVRFRQTLGSSVGGFSSPFPMIVVAKDDQSPLSAFALVQNLLTLFKARGTLSIGNMTLPIVTDICSSDRDRRGRDAPARG